MTTIGLTPQNDAPHKPVLLAEVLAAIQPKDGGIYVDGTFGAGGYSTGLLNAASCRVYGIDRDETAILAAEKLRAHFGDRLAVLNGRFGDMADLLSDAGVDRVDGIALDIGVSSMQLDQADRGFSFRNDGPLDMRMGQSGQTAADLVNRTAEGDLADIIYTYGEERASRRVAKAICRARAEKPIERTLELAEVVRSALPRPKSRDAIDPATRTFQALRIKVNDELGELERGLEAAEGLLSEGGRLVVVTFHSLEDRIVKRFIRDRSGRRASGSRHLPVTKDEGPVPSFIDVSRKAITAGDAEVAFNPRARSAKLRVAERTQAPAFSGGLS